jgi:site-specific DNA recombinase
MVSLRLAPASATRPRAATETSLFRPDECAVCGGGFDLSSHDFLVCFNARSRGTCPTAAASGGKTSRPACCARWMSGCSNRRRLREVCEGFAAEMERQRREHLKQRAGARRALETVDREIPTIIKDELEALEARKAALTIASAETPMQALHPHMAEVFRQKVMSIASTVCHSASSTMRSSGTSTAIHATADSTAPGACQCRSPSRTADGSKSAGRCKARC